MNIICLKTVYTAKNYILASKTYITYDQIQKTNKPFILQISSLKLFFSLFIDR